jgi:hypothetical protein
MVRVMTLTPLMFPLLILRLREQRDFGMQFRLLVRDFQSGAAHHLMRREHVQSETSSVRSLTTLCGLTVTPTRLFTLHQQIRYNKSYNKIKGKNEAN